MRSKRRRSMQRLDERSECKPDRAQPVIDERSECKPDRAQPVIDERSECKPDRAQPVIDERSECKPDRAQPVIDERSECKPDRAQPVIDERSECKPDRAQPVIDERSECKPDRAQPVIDERSECKPDRAQPVIDERSECKPDRAQPVIDERSECKPDRAQPVIDERSECKPDRAQPVIDERSECKPDRAQPVIDERSECKPDRAQPGIDKRRERSTRPTGRSLKECKPDAKRKPDRAQPKEKAQPGIDDIQSNFRDAVVLGETGPVAEALTGGDNPERRLAIHQRNYQASLTDALLMKFPATEWLLGTVLFTEAAQCFVRENPPGTPCIAEYGTAFPDFLRQYAGTEALPYVSEFARLEWYVGRVAIAADPDPAGPTAFSHIKEDALPDATLRLQSGLHYQQASWPIDELLTLYLSGTAPDQFELRPGSIWIEVRGNRGEFQLNRLEPAEFVFRKSISEGRPIGEAAERAMDLSSGFDPGRGLTALLAAGLV